MSRHIISTSVEGKDIYFQRSVANENRFVHLLYTGKRWRGRDLRTTDDVVLPSAVSDEALEALIAAKEAENQQQATAVAAQMQQIWDMTAANVADTESDDDPE